MYPIQVAEAEIAASGGRRSSQRRSKILKSAIFELHKHYTPQKKAENNHHSDFKPNQRQMTFPLHQLKPNSKTQ